MHKRGLFVFLLVLIVLSVSVSSAESSVSDEMQRITHYAEEYETGNINYVQLVVYMANVRESLNGLMGMANKREGGILRQEKLREVLGEPAEETKWVWVDREDREMKLESPVPVWRKIVFDGKKIQIRLSAHPSVIKKTTLAEENRDAKIDMEDFEDLGDGRFLVYRLNFETEFKKPAEQLDVQSKIDEIKVLAEEFNSDSSQENGEELAKASVNVERAFQSYFSQSGGDCENILLNIFGSENKREAQKMIVQEIEFMEGDNYVLKVRLEMCEDCDWKWVNLNAWVEGRGPGFRGNEGEPEMVSPDEFKSLSWEGFESKTISLLEEYKEAANKKEWGRVNSLNSRMWALSDAWNQKSNDVWKEMDVSFETKREGMSEEERREFDENYGWIKEEQERRKEVKEVQEQNYQKRKAFYENLFKDYEKKEYYYEKTGFEKRLIELFKENGEEICDNNLDDNGNEKIDCGDEQCGGKICGKLTGTNVVGNESFASETEMYCIMSTCQVKEEVVEVISGPVCGNHICEEGEMGGGLAIGNADGNESLPGIGTCAEDCSLCAEYEALNCSGRVIFSGKDENGCSLEPVCVEEDLCETNEDCKFLCGVGVCVEGRCESGELVECREPDCVDGQKKVENCGGEELVVEFCEEGLWKGTGLECETEGTPVIQEESAGESISGDECVTRDDCGGEDDVCSNGHCVTIPENSVLSEENEEVREEDREFEEPQESPAEEEPAPVEESSPEPEAEPSVTGEVVFAPLKLINDLFIGLFNKGSITGLSVDEGTGGEIADDGSSESGDANFVEGTQVEPPPQESPPPAEGGGDVMDGSEGERFDEPINQEEREDDRRDDERREGENRNRCEEDCGRMCYDNKARPCVDECIREECGQELECEVDSVREKCEESCGGDVDACVSECVPKCTSGGEDWWKEFERKPEQDMHKEEKGVFQVGGECRQAQGGKTEGFIWFGGWGEPFDRIQILKQKYYSGGDADWCKWDFENLKKQRAEFEQGFNEEFAKWFFEKYLANSADKWEQHVSGIFELYWKNVDISRQMAERMNCLGVKEFPDVNLVNVKYESDYGSIEFWEELKTVKLPGMDEETEVVSPYMKVWIFPSKEVIKLEMKKAMEEHRMPGPEGESEQIGPSDEEKEEMRRDEGGMKMIRELSEKYGGSFDGVVQFKDYETDEVVFNLYVKIDEEDLVSVEPMLYSEVPSEDARAELDFEILYDIIYTSEKEMRGIQTESPPWDKEKFEPVKKIKEVTNGAKMWGKARQLISSAKYYPESAEEDMSFFMKEMFKGMFGGGPGEGGSPEEMEEEGFEGGGDIFEDKEVVTGEVILWE